MGKFRKANKREANNTQDSLEQKRFGYNEENRLTILAVKGLITASVYGGHKPTIDSIWNTISLIKNMEKKSNLRISEIKPDVTFNIEKKGILYWCGCNK